MHPGISSYTYTWAIGVPGHAPARSLTAHDLLHQGARLGASVVQIADNLPLHTMSDHELAALSACARSLGLAIEVGTRGIAPDHLRTYLRIARQMAATLVRTVVDTAGHRPDPPEVVSVLRQVLPEYEETGVTLALENHDRFKSNTLADIVAAVGSQSLGICLDTVNSFGALEGPEVVVETLGPLAVNVHIKDFVVVRASHQMGFVIEGRPAGEGQLDVPWLLRRLREFGRDPNLILELWTPPVSPDGRDPEAALAQTIAKEAEWAVRSMAYLRSLERSGST